MFQNTSVLDSNINFYFFVRDC